jgi:uncharacterized membrane protein YjgN (DUF898 family)
MSPVTQTPPPGQPPGQPPYGSYPPNPYGGVPFPLAPDHPQATLVLVLGIVGIVVCGVVAPFAWVMGSRVVKEIDASNGQLGGRSQAQAGRICGIIGTCLIGLGLLAAVAIVVIALVATAGSTT